MRELSSSPFPASALPRFTIRGKVFFWSSAFMLAVGVATVDEKMVQLSLFTLLSLVPIVLINWYNLKNIIIKSDMMGSTCAGKPFDSVLSVANSKSMASMAVKVMNSMKGERGGCIKEFHLSSWHTEQIHAQIPALKRGVYQELHSLQLRSSFPFGIFYSEAPLTLRSDLVVYPAPEIPKRFEEILFNNGDGDHTTWKFEMDHFAGLREFCSGDSLKFVSWKSTAKSQRLITTTFEDESPRVQFYILFWSHEISDLMCANSFEKSLQQLAGIFLSLYTKRIPIQFTASFIDWKILSLNPERQNIDILLAHLASAKQTTPNTLGEIEHQLQRISLKDRPIIISNSPLSSWTPYLRTKGKSCLCFDNHHFIKLT